MPPSGVALFCFSPSPPPLRKTFFVNFLEVMKEKRIFAAWVHKEECIISAMTCLFSLLQSVNSATSFCKQIRLILLTNSNLRDNEVISSSQRNRIFKPAQSNLQASWSLWLFTNNWLVNPLYAISNLFSCGERLLQKFFFSNLMPLISHLDLTIWL